MNKPDPTQPKQLKSATALITAVASLQFVLCTPTVSAQEVFINATSSRGNFPTQYTALTKKLLTAGIELERFSLNYRLESAIQPKFRRERYFLSQEAGAAGILTFEIIGDRQFGRGRNGLLAISPKDLRGSLASVKTAIASGQLKTIGANGALPAALKAKASNDLKSVGGSLLTVSPSALHGATATVLTTSIVAGAGSCLELGSNFLLSLRNKSKGYDPKSANEFVISHLKKIDAILDERERLVQAHTDNPAYERAVLEGKILHQLRDAMVDEYVTFHADAKQYAVLSNLYYFLNTCSYAVGAAGAGVAYRAVQKPTLNGPANILFIVTGSMLALTPLVANAAGRLARKTSRDSFYHQLGQRPTYDPAELTSLHQRLNQLSSTAPGTLIPELPILDRSALYSESQTRFSDQLQSELTIMRMLNNVAFESCLFAPIVGGTLLTQGILGTVGYYKYTFQPKKQFSNYFAGAVVGTTGAGIAVAANAASLVSGWAYENKLQKEHRLPRQLIQDRLEHLNDLEKTVNSL